MQNKRVTLEKEDPLLLGWFKLNLTDPDACLLRYSQLPMLFTWNRKEKKFQRRQRFFKNGGIKYECKKMEKDPYLKLLFQVIKGPTCDQDLKTYRGIIYGTYHEACIGQRPMSLKMHLINSCSDRTRDVVSINLIPFEQIFDGSHAMKNQTLDLLGQVVKVGTKIRIVDPQGNVPAQMISVIRFSLRDLSGSEVECVAYHHHADAIESHLWASNLWNCSINHNVALLRSWRVTYNQAAGQRMEIASDPNVSQITFNPNFPETLHFKMRLADNDHDYTYDSDDSSDE